MMKLKTLFKSTALLFLSLGIAFSAAANTKKMYGINGDKMSIPTKVSAPSSYSVNGVTYTTKNAEAAKSYSKEGIASYYHSKFNGRRTANGEIYNSTLYTAAHKTLPMNSYALVTNLHNNRKVIVRINDRGPFSNKRIIDLSHAAAKELGLIARGTGQVRIEALHVERNGKLSGAGAKTLAKHAKTQEASDRLAVKQNAPSTPNAKSGEAQKNQYALKMLNVMSKKDADKLVTQLALNNVKTEVRQNKGNQYYEIHFGPFDKKTQMAQLKNRLQKMAKNPLIVYSYQN